MTKEGSKQSAIEGLRVAADKLEIAQILLSKAKFAGAISAAYHEGTRNLFSLHLIKTGKFPATDGRLLRNMHKAREDADDSHYAVFTQDEADEAVSAAEAFLTRARAYVSQA